MKQAREAATGDPERIALTARTLKEIVWETGQTDQARVAAMKQLLNDPDPSVAADARQLGKLILPPEQSRAMVALLSATAGDRGWNEYGPALVRAYARPVKGVKDEERTERVALTALAEGKELTDVIFGIFLDPGEESGITSIKGTRLDARQRVRSDAWDLLARLDKHGDRRAQLLGHSLANAPNDPILAALAAGHDELRVIPLAGEELFWLCAMRDFTKQGRKAWWDACKQAIAQTPQGETIRLRHLEAIRWATAHRSAWLSQSQDALIAELRQRLKGRETAARSWGNGSPTYRERLDDARLSWADALTALVLDEAIRSQGPPAVAERLVQYASQDRQDPTSEYGGLIVLREDDRCADALLYPPQATPSWTAMLPSRTTAR
jgi:hypothetical protein